MKTTASYLRVIGITIIAFFLFEYIAGTDEEFAFISQPIVGAIIAVVVIISISAEICFEAFKTILFKTLSPEARGKYLASEALKKENQFKWIKELYQQSLGSRPIEEEHEIILDHNYDGIQELDNNLPPWWVYGFYATIVFALIYMVRYHVFDGANQANEYEYEIAKAKIAIEEYKKTAKNLMDVNTVELLTNASDLKSGKTIFMEKCVACHKADGGGGIGPNLTDPNWILGGGIKNVFRTISEGGRPSKGMVAWKTELKPLEMAQVASYVLSLQGTTPVDPKEAQGDIWEKPLPKN
ncbi:cbb3-type cytochrome c oxidase N-terminal domain-containing protein [Aquimarina agarivorans]|uniref:cbb3-type cytochrome c oxidase N-terminal domain-containing protein n=1 Tax=Aquimarina agarivorans TaxID=980584 RepID=UPI000248EBC6|nr:cbb3-type cytochrome c oxidase N-terminal domain-containing protein [Aquimarina agarivorans]